MGHSDLVWKLEWKTVITQSLSTNNSLRMLVKQIFLRMLGTGREQQGTKGPLTWPGPFVNSIVVIKRGRERMITPRMKWSRQGPEINLGAWAPGED